MSSFTTPLKYITTDKTRSGRPIYRLTEPFDYVIGSKTNPIDQRLTIPVGFETDLASVPWPFRLIFHPDGPWAKAACVHDYLYRMNKFDQTHVVADAIFLEAMLVSGVSKPIAVVFFLAVWIFGNPCYTKQLPMDGTKILPSLGHQPTNDTKS